MKSPTRSTNVSDKEAHRICFRAAKTPKPSNTPKFSEAQGFELRRRVLTLLAGPGQQAVEARGLLRCRGILSSRVMPACLPDLIL